MKYWLGILNMVAVGLIIFQVSIFHNQLQIDERDFQSEVLATAIDNATEYAFSNSLAYSSLNQQYDKMQTLTLDPTNVLLDFETIMCCCYNMALTEQNLKYVESCIDGGVLCDADGYYTLMIGNKPLLNDGDKVKDSGNRYFVKFDNFGGSAVVKEKLTTTENRNNELIWSVKLPYEIKIDNQTIGLNITNGDTIVVMNNNVVRHSGISERSKIPYTFRQNGKEETYYKFKENYIYMDFAGTAFSKLKLSDDLKIQRINNLLATALNTSVQDIVSTRGINANYTVYLPSSTTQSGVNPITSNTLLLSMSKASFAGKYAFLSEPVLSGYKAVSKEYIVGFIEDGEKRYCYASQLPETIKREEVFYSMYDAMMANYQPSFKYLKYPLSRTLINGKE